MFARTFVHSTVLTLILAALVLLQQFAFPHHRAAARLTATPEDPTCCEAPSEEFAVRVPRAYIGGQVNMGESR